MGTFAGQHNEKASNIIFFKYCDASHWGRAVPVLVLQCREQAEAVPSQMLLHAGAKLEPVLPLSNVRESC